VTTLQNTISQLRTQRARQGMAPTMNPATALAFVSPEDLEAATGAMTRARLRSLRALIDETTRKRDDLIALREGTLAALRAVAALPDLPDTAAAQVRSVLASVTDSDPSVYSPTVLPESTFDDIREDHEDHEDHEDTAPSHSEHATPAGARTKPSVRVRATPARDEPSEHEQVDDPSNGTTDFLDHVHSAPTHDQARIDVQDAVGSPEPEAPPQLGEPFADLTPVQTNPFARLQRSPASVKTQPAAESADSVEAAVHPSKPENTPPSPAPAAAATDFEDQPPQQSHTPDNPVGHFMNPFAGIAEESPTPESAASTEPVPESTATPGLHTAVPVEIHQPDPPPAGPVSRARRSFTTTPQPAATSDPFAAVAHEPSPSPATQGDPFAYTAPAPAPAVSTPHSVPAAAPPAPAGDNPFAAWAQQPPQPLPTPPPSAWPSPSTTHDTAPPQPQLRRRPLADPAPSDNDLSDLFS